VTQVTYVAGSEGSRCRRAVSGDFEEAEARVLQTEEKIRLLSMVDVLEPLSEEELEEFSRRVPDKHVERGRIFYTRTTAARRSSCSKRGG
jgi:hypothetical protein